MDKKINLIFILIVSFYGCAKNNQHDLNKGSMDLKSKENQCKIVGGKDSNNIFNIDPNDPKLYQFLSTPAHVKGGPSN